MPVLDISKQKKNDKSDCTIASLPTMPKINLKLSLNLAHLTINHQRQLFLCKSYFLENLVQDGPNEVQSSNLKWARSPKAVLGRSMGWAHICSHFSSLSQIWAALRCNSTAQLTAQCDECPLEFGSVNWIYNSELMSSEFFILNSRYTI